MDSEVEINRIIDEYKAKQEATVDRFVQDVERGLNRLSLILVSGAGGLAIVTLVMSYLLKGLN